MMRRAFATALLVPLAACQTAIHSERTAEATAVSGLDGAKIISGSLVHADKCGGFRSEGRLSNWAVPNGTRWDPRGGRDRLTFPDGSVAESGKEYQFLGRETDEKSDCYPTTVVLYRVLDGREHTPVPPPVIRVR